MAARRESSAAFLRALARALGVAVAAVGATVIAGWAARQPSLTRLVPGYVAMGANTAAALVLLGVAAALQAKYARGPAARRGGAFLAAFALVLGVLTLVEAALAPGLRLDEWMFPDPWFPPEAATPRMPLTTALAVALLGASLLFMDAENAAGRRPAQLLALAAALVPLQATVGWLYGLPSAAGVSPYTQVALHSGAAITLLCVAVLLARPDRGLMRAITTSGPAGMLARRLLPVTVAIPIALGWVFLVAGLRAGHYEALVGATFVVVSAVVMGVALVWWNAGELHAIDEARSAAEAAVADLLAREREARADAEQASRAKDEFIATLSHELRTPLNSVLGWARLLRIGKLDADGVRRAVEAIERGATTQAQIVDDLLDVSRIVRGQLQLDVRPVDLAPIVDAAVETVRPAAAAREIELATVLSRPAVVAGDAGRLQQVLWNLLANAIKFTPPGGRVEVRLEPGARTVELAVRDTGSGIPPGFLPHVFERFSQADSSTTRAHGGLGLGLAIVRHLVEAHGGTVAAESAGVGRGSTFRVSLPRAAARPRAATPAPVRPRAAPQVAPAPAVLERLRVLVVDDDPDTLEVVKQLLEQAGAAVTAAASAPEALACLGREVPDVLVSDIGMPGQDGYALIRAVRSLDPARGGSVPAAALTAFTHADVRHQVLRAGFQLYLAKPIEPAALTAAVARLAGRAAAEDRSAGT